MFFLIEVTTTGDQTAKAIWEKSSITEAAMALFQGMASAMANPNVRTALYMVIDHKGAIARYEYWERPNVS